LDELSHAQLRGATRNVGHCRVEHVVPQHRHERDQRAVVTVTFWKAGGSVGWLV